MRSAQALEVWYDTMWAACDHTRVPELAAAHYLRHDITGANNLMTSQTYSEMVGFATANESVAEFDYSLFSEGPYVASLGRLLFKSDRQWDWVQLFRVDEDGRLAETWLAGMGGNDVFGYPQPHTAWTGTELPSFEASSPAKTLIHDYVTRVWEKGDLAAIEEFCAPTLISHDQLGARRRLTADDVANEIKATLDERGPLKVTQSFVIGEGDKVCAAWTWSFENGVQWDLVQAFRIEHGRVAESWLPVIGGTDSALSVGPDTRWARDDMMSPARHPRP